MVSFSSPARKEPFLVLQCKIPGEWLYPSVGCDILLETWPSLERARGTKWPRPADSTTCSQDCIFQESNVTSNSLCKMTAEQLSISFLFTELIASDTGATAENNLFGDWFQSLALDFTCIFKVKGLSQCRDCTILPFFAFWKNLKLAVN